MRVFNMMEKGENSAAAAELFLSLNRNADAREVLANSTSSAIYTKGLRLQEYTQALFGWSPYSNQAVTHYGIMTSSEGLKGVCYLDGYCGESKAVGSFVSSVTGHTQIIYSGDLPTYPHVGLGYASQVIVWGYDHNAKTLANGVVTHWANWNDDQACCLAGATDDIALADTWRYAILIR